MQEGGNCFEDEDEWKAVMEEHSIADQEAEAGTGAQGARQGASAIGGAGEGLRGECEREQSQVGGTGEGVWRDFTAVEKILPDDMVKPALRTPGHLQDILES
jgi:hypothetical protein